MEAQLRGASFILTSGVRYPTLPDKPPFLMTSEDKQQSACPDSVFKPNKKNVPREDPSPIRERNIHIVETNSSEKKIAWDDNMIVAAINPSHSTGHDADSNAALNNKLGNSLSDPGFIAKLNDYAIRFFNREKDAKLSSAYQRMQYKYKNLDNPFVEFAGFCDYLSNKVKCNDVISNDEKWLFKFCVTGMLAMEETKSAKSAKAIVRILHINCHPDHSQFEGDLYRCVLIKRKPLMELIDHCWEDIDIMEHSGSVHKKTACVGNVFKSSVKVYKNGQYIDAINCDLQYFLDNFPDHNYGSIDVIPDRGEVEKVRRLLGEEYKKVEMYLGILDAKSDKASITFDPYKNYGMDMAYINKQLNGKNIGIVFFIAYTRKNTSAYTIDFPYMAFLPDKYPVSYTANIRVPCIHNIDSFYPMFRDQRNCRYSFIYNDGDGVVGISYTSEELRSFDFRANMVTPISAIFQRECSIL